MTGSRWQAIVDEITAGIASGQWPPGTRIPSINQLASTHHVSRGTAARAIDVLKARGLVVGDQGVGTLVAGGEAGAGAVDDPVGELRSEVAALRAEVAELRARVRDLEQRPPG